MSKDRVAKHTVSVDGKWVYPAMLDKLLDYAIDNEDEDLITLSMAMLWYCMDKNLFWKPVGIGLEYVKDLRNYS